MTRTAIGWVQIHSNDPPVALFARLSDERPSVEAGYGGWSEVARPRRRPLTVWAGSPALRMTLPILIDRWREGDSVERTIAQLERLAQPTASDGSPPRVLVDAQGGAVPHQERVWVIDDLAWGDALMNSWGDRSRQQVTLSLLEYIRDVRVEEDSAALAKRLEAQTAASKKSVAASKKSSGATQKRVVVKAKPSSRPVGPVPVLALAEAEPAAPAAGEDLLSIAARELGSAARWVEIAQLNGLRDPRNTQAGQVIRLP